MTPQPNEYRCAMCQQVYTKAITDEEAMAETQSHWPGVVEQDCAVVCDDCYQKISPEAHPQEYRDSLLESIERTYRAARTDATTGEALPVDVVLRKLIDQVCKTFDIPEATLYTDDPLEWARIIGVKLAIPPEDMGEQAGT